MHYVAWLGLWPKVKCLNPEEFVVVISGVAAHSKSGRVRRIGRMCEVIKSAIAAFWLIKAACCFEQIVRWPHTGRSHP